MKRKNILFLVCLFILSSVSAQSTSSEDKDTPVVFLIGDSTVKNGSGKGDGNQWGWGSFFEQFFDTCRISIENHALGGRSSRTFYTEGLWDNVLPRIKKGDYLLIQFGHNDGGSLNTGRARASLPGIGEESETVIMEKDGNPEVVFTFGHYLRIYIQQAKAKGTNVILLSHTPGNTWINGKMERNNETYGKWTSEVAEQERIPYIDLNDIAARIYESEGEELTKKYFIDRVHTSYDGAILHGKAVIEGIRNIKDYPLNDYIKK